MYILPQLKIKKLMKQEWCLWTIGNDMGICKMRWVKKQDKKIICGEESQLCNQQGRLEIDL